MLPYLVLSAIANLAQSSSSRREDTKIAQCKRSAALGNRPTQDSAPRRAAAKLAFSLQSHSCDCPATVAPRTSLANFLRLQYGGSRSAMDLSSTLSCRAFPILFLALGISFATLAQPEAGSSFPSASSRRAGDQPAPPPPSADYRAVRQCLAQRQVATLAASRLPCG